MKARPFVALIPALVIVLLAVVIEMGTSDGEAAVEPTAVPHFRQTDVRVEIVDDARESRNQDPVYVQLESGEIPEDVRFLTVLTDEDCVPDPQGVSHCLNRVEFQTDDGIGHAALRHHHNMAIEPCLAPGQTLELVTSS